MSDSNNIESTEQFEEKKQATSSVKSFISGGFGGISAVLVGHPFDLTKTRLQTAKEGTYTGGLDVVKKTIKADGIKGSVEELRDRTDMILYLQINPISHSDTESQSFFSMYQNVSWNGTSPRRSHSNLCYLLLVL